MSTLLASIQKIQIKSVSLALFAMLFLALMNPVTVAAKDGQSYASCKSPQWVVGSRNIYSKGVKVGTVTMYECSNRYYFAHTKYMTGGAKQTVAVVHRTTVPKYYNGTQTGKFAATSKLVDVRSGCYEAFGSVKTTKYPTANAKINFCW